MCTTSKCISLNFCIDILNKKRHNNNPSLRRTTKPRITVSETMANIYFAHYVKVVHKPLFTLCSQIMQLMTLENHKTPIVIYCMRGLPNHIGETKTKRRIRLYTRRWRRQEGSYRIWVHMVEANQPCNFSEHDNSPNRSEYCLSLMATVKKPYYTSIVEKTREHLDTTSSVKKQNSCLVGIFKCLGIECGAAYHASVHTQEKKHVSSEAN